MTPLIYPLAQGGLSGFPTQKGLSEHLHDMMRVVRSGP